MDRDDARQDRKQDDGEGDGRTSFERFVEVVQSRVSSAPFFLICLTVVAVWFVSVPLWPDLKQWQVAIHTVASVLSILLLVLLENSGRRAEEASQEKLNVIAEGLAELMESHARTDPELAGATRKLREAVGLEERH
jgi:low affinity Fe/Cu permease